MTAFAARHRLILLAWAGMVVLLLVTALFSPGFLSASNLRSVLILAAFVGIVALGQTFVIIGGGIDLSVPWVLNCAALLMTMMAAGQDSALVWVIPLILAGGAAIGFLNGVGVAFFQRLDYLHMFVVRCHGVAEKMTFQTPNLDA